MRLDIRGRHVVMTAGLRDHIMTRLHFALGRLTGRVAGIVVRLEDVNGPRGGADLQCRIVVRLAAGGELVTEVLEADPRVAVDVAAGRLARQVVRTLRRLPDHATVRTPDAAIA